MNLPHLKKIYLVLLIIVAIIFSIFIFWLNNKNAPIDISVSDGSSCSFLDSNQDGSISLPDFQSFASVWGKDCFNSVSSPVDSCGLQDSNLNNKIDKFDFINFASNWRKSCVPLESVPDEKSDLGEVCSLDSDCVEGLVCNLNDSNIKVCQNPIPDSSPVCNPACTNGLTCVRPHPINPSITMCSMLSRQQTCDQFNKICNDENATCHQINGSTAFTCVIPNTRFLNVICDSFATCTDGLECKKTLNVNTGALNSIAYCIDGNNMSICDANNPCASGLSCETITGKDGNNSPNRYCVDGSIGNYCDADTPCKSGLTCTLNGNWSVCK